MKSNHVREDLGEEFFRDVGRLARGNLPVAAFAKNAGKASPAFLANAATGRSSPAARLDGAGLAGFLEGEVLAGVQGTVVVATAGGTPAAVAVGDEEGGQEDNVEAMAQKGGR